MKKTVLSVLAMGFLLAVGSASAYAQLPGMTMRASIPFAFYVRGKTLPAGEYEIKRVYDTPDVLRITEVGKHEHEHAVFNTEPVEPRKTPNKSEIVFHRYGDSYFLAEVLTGGEQTGRELLPSHQEKVLMREMLSDSRKAKPETVAIALY